MTARTTKTAASTKPTAAQIAQAKKDVAAQRKLRADAELKAQADAILSAEDSTAEHAADHASMFSNLNFDFRSFCESLGVAIVGPRSVRG